MKSKNILFVAVILATFSFMNCGNTNSDIKKEDTEVISAKKPDAAVRGIYPETDYDNHVFRVDVAWANGSSNDIQITISLVHPELMPAGVPPPPQGIAPMQFATLRKYTKGGRSTACAIYGYNITNGFPVTFTCPTANLMAWDNCSGKGFDAPEITVRVNASANNPPTYSQVGSNNVRVVF